MREGRNNNTDRPAWRNGAEEFALQRNQESVKGEGVSKPKGQRRRKLYQVGREAQRALELQSKVLASVHQPLAL